MKKLNLRTKAAPQTMELPIEFIDNYMPSASDIELKVYLYLVRASADSSILLSTNDMAELFDVTPKKITQALLYWSERKILLLDYQDGEISDVTLLPLPNAKTAPQQTVFSNAKPFAVQTAPIPEGKPAVILNIPAEPFDYQAVLEDPAFTDILGLAEYYLAKPISQTMSSTLAEIYVDLGRQSDVVEYLLEYCIENHHTSPHYMKGVAEGWKNDGLSTLAEIKASAAAHNKNVYGIMKALGIGNREPASSEMDFIKSWLTDFDLSIILEACHRTVMNAHTPDFRYCNGILSRWKESGVKTFSDIDVLDKAHDTRKKKDSSGESAPKNGFNNFSQRNTDYDALFSDAE